ncbi:hypothetical protein MHT86_10040 [Corynebacterium mastitidis]|uniref:Uncharacterized protein n=1 Tax=Corynebacterium mastitidis TaxID=161890 RepID=A0A2N0X8Z4_9CORY|nr:hypothetical protein [Corynebacterium mastitidis]MCH6197824.1 hypothetical protein [Corynebacterium mastitidis]PKF69180.1 hypothetical protein CXB45_03305 [Corynebacterium mastitidis]
MKVADFAALSLAENNADAVSWYVPLSPLSDENWQTVVRGVRHYEQAVQRHLGRQVDRSVWVGDTYVMYGEDGPLEAGLGYVGVRRKRQQPAGWWPCVLADRGKEASGGIAQAGCFEVAWKQVMWWLVLEHFLLSPRWRRQGRTSFFQGELAPGCSCLTIAPEGPRPDPLVVPAPPEMEVRSGRASVRWWRDRNWVVDPGEGPSLSWGSGYVFTSDSVPRQWYMDGSESLTDLSWGLGVEVEEYIDRLFEAAL